MCVEPFDNLWISQTTPTFPGFPPLSHRSLSALLLTASSLFLAESQQLAGSSRVRNTESSLLATMVLQKRAVAAAEKHAGYCSWAFLWSPEASGWQKEPGTAQGSKVPGEHGFTESQGSCYPSWCRSEARPEETQNKIQTDRSRVTWHRKANGCQETAFKLPGPWHHAWSSASRVNSGIGVVVIFFCQSTGFRLGREDLPGSSRLHSSLKVNGG